MEVLHVLEQKISSLIEIIHDLKKENAKLVEENAQLIAKIAVLETTMLKGSKDSSRLENERELTRLAVDNLIKSIDLLVENEKQQ